MIINNPVSKLALLVGFTALALLVAGHTAAGAARGGCPKGLRGSPLVFVGAPGSPYCIDAREVTQHEYAAFVQASAAQKLKQSAECAANDAFTAPVFSQDMPTPAGHCRAGAYDPKKKGKEAVGCVDWCDAKAYCEWAGKRLCDGLAGHPETLERQDDASASEWQHACVEGGDAPIASLTNGVREWTAACDADRGACSLQGGDSCEATGVTQPTDTHPTIGIRCCADATSK